jgi:aminoglycoside phosphotransferase (APT) family kinase protein
MNAPTPAQAPGPRALAWAEGVLGHSIHRTRRLVGSPDSALYRLEFTGGTAVIRQIVNADWLEREPDVTGHEAASLERAALSGLPAPQVLARDETGRESGAPALLMSCLPGVVNLVPDDLEAYLGELARTLDQLHALTPIPFAWSYSPYWTPSDAASWSGVPDAWARALAVVQGPVPTFTPRFIHRDFHPANVLWQDTRISGVVDWVNGCLGPPGVDVAHCAVNLAQLFGPEAAQMFQAAYQHLSGHVQHPYWDLSALLDFVADGPPTVYPGWPSFGLSTLSDELIRQRLDTWMLRVLERTETG